MKDRRNCGDGQHQNLLAQRLTPQFKVVTGKRTTHNPQREKPVASTEEDGVAYLYHAGLDGFEIGKLYYVSPKRREVYENPGFRSNSGPDRDRERVYTRGPSSECPCSLCPPPTPCT